MPTADPHPCPIFPWSGYASVAAQPGCNLLILPSAISHPHRERLQRLPLQAAGKLCVGRSPFEITLLMRQAYQQLFAASCMCSAPRFSAQVLAGPDMALWGIAGKAMGRAVHELLRMKPVTR